MDTVVYDRIDKLEVKTDSLMAIVTELQKSVLLPEWIEDLEVNKKSSETFANDDRMNTLIGESSATRNLTIVDILFEWAVENNELPRFFTSCVGTSVISSWDSFTTIAALCANASAFTAVANNEAAIQGVAHYAPSHRQLFLNYSTTEAALQGSEYAISALTDVADVWQQRRGQSLVFTKDMFVLYCDNDDVGTRTHVTRVVKSVQRGVYAGDTTNGTVAIPISEINSSKSVLLVNGVPEGDRCSLSNSSILCEEDGGRLAHFYLGWQVVEFY